MVIVQAIQHFHMQVHCGRVGYRIEEFPDHLCVHRSKAWNRKIDLIIQIRSAGQIDCAEDKRLVHRKDKAAEAADARLVTGCLPDGLAEHDAAVFNRVVGVHESVSVAGQFKIEHSVSCKSIQHMVKEPYPRIDVANATPVKIDRNPDISLFCLSRYSCNSGHVNRLSVSVSISACFSRSKAMRILRHGLY